MKKLFAVLLAVAMLLSLGVTAFAATPGTIVVADPPEGVEYIAYKIFDATVTDGKVTYTIADSSPWFDILFEEDADGNIVGKDDAVNFKVTGDASPYTVEAEEGYSAADFAAWVMSNVDDTDWPAAGAYKSTTDATGAVEIADNGAALPAGYYLIAPLTDSATAGSTDFSYTDDTTAWTSKKAYDALTDEQKNVYDEVNCYYATSDTNKETPVPAAYYNALSDAEKANYGDGKAYTRKASINAATFRALDKTYQAQYTSDAPKFALDASKYGELNATAYGALTDAAQKNLYEAFDVVYKTGSTTDYVAKELYDLMSDAQKAAYEATVGTAYKTKDVITAAEYLALGQSTDNTVRALQGNYTGVPSSTGAPDTSKVAALTTVLSDKVTQIQNKNDMPLDKEVDGADADEDYDDNETAVKVGDVLNYKISTKIPANYADGKEYEFLVTDTMSKGLTFKDDIVIKIGNDEDHPDIEISLKNQAAPTISVNKNNNPVDLTNANAVYDAIGELFELVTTDKTLSGNEIRYGSEEGEPTFELSIATWSHALRPYAGMPLIITYSATVNEDAKGQLVQNAAVLEYTDENGLHVKDAETDNYIARIVVDKFETGNRSQKLPGAEFVLYKLNDSGEKLYYKIENKVVTWESDIANATTVTTDENGFAEFLYLEDGTYYLREVKAPVDYARLLDDIEIVVDGSDAVDHRLTQAQRDNILSPVANVANTPGSSMPSTGGVGATLLTIGGVALMLAAGAFLVLRRRKEQE